MAKRRILVVEDDCTIRETIAELLQEEGYGVTCAGNGVEALAALAHEEAPGLILLDLMMPVMNGWELRDALSHDPRLSRIPVVVVSAGTAADAAASLGADAFLPKPFEITALLDAVGRHCC